MKTRIHPIIVVLVVLALCGTQQGCGDDEYQRQRQIAEINARIAHACVPYPDEQRVMSWAIGAEGKRVLYVTARQHIGTKGNTAQFMVVSESEIQP